MTTINTKLPGVKRLLREAKELSVPTSLYYACPLDDNIFEWHFTLRGPAQSVYENGIYHGRIIFPTDYPIKPPEIVFLTPNGRFQANQKICLSVSAYHPELWRPCWGVRTMLLAIIGFFPTPAEGAIGSTTIPDSEKLRLAHASRDWKCSICNIKNEEILKSVNEDNENQNLENEAQELRGQIYIAQKEMEIENLVEIDQIDKETEQEASVKNLDENSSDNRDLCVKRKISNDVIQNDQDTDFPFPWSDHEKVQIDKHLLNDLFVFTNTDFVPNKHPAMEFQFPKYDWKLEEEKNKRENTEVQTVQDQNAMIQNLQINIENVFSFRYHIRSTFILCLYVFILVILGKKLFLSLYLLINNLTD